MTHRHTDNPTAAAYRVGDPVQVQHRGHRTPGRIASIRRTAGGVRYDVATDPPPGATGAVVTIWTTTARTLSLSHVPAGAFPVPLPGHHDRLCWTPLGIRMGFTRRRSQRDQILAATARMTWTPMPTRAPYLDGPAVRAVVAALCRRDQIDRVGIAPVYDGAQLIGVGDAVGTRRLVLDRDTEAIHLLTVFADRPARDQPRVA